MTRSRKGLVVGGAIGVFITLEKASSHMTDEAASAGFVTSEHFHES